LPRRENDLPPLVATDAKGRRCKIWDIAPSLHCSIIGTCRSAAELRQFFTKLGDTDAKMASDNIRMAAAFDPPESTIWSGNY